MESALLGLAILACPVGMGLMMLFIAKGMRKDHGPERPREERGLHELREEHRRLGAEIDLLDRGKTDRVRSGARRP